MKVLLIILIVIAVLFLLSFLVYITNADMKMVEGIYDKLIAYHDAKNKEEKL